jgi:hypothetical protein
LTLALLVGSAGLTLAQGGGGDGGPGNDVVLSNDGGTFNQA